MVVALVWCEVALVTFLNIKPDLFTSGALWFDNALRLVQIRDLLAGQLRRAGSRRPRR